MLILIGVLQASFQILSHMFHSSVRSYVGYTLLLAGRTTDKANSTKTLQAYISSKSCLPKLSEANYQDLEARTGLKAYTKNHGLGV